MTVRDKVLVAIGQIEFARQYTRSLIDDLSDEEWFAMPAGSVTHIAWQVGHLAMAQYGLCLFRIRGRSPHDNELMNSSFRKRFMRGSQADPDIAANPSPEEIRGVLNRVHQQAISELTRYDDAALQAPIDEPYAVEATKLGGLYFCAAHEMLHAGQIGLLRRLLGKPSLR